MQYIRHRCIFWQLLDVQSKRKLPVGSDARTVRTAGPFLAQPGWGDGSGPVRWGYRAALYRSVVIL